MGSADQGGDLLTVLRDSAMKRVGFFGSSEYSNTISFMTRSCAPNPKIFGEHIAGFDIDLRDKRWHLEAPGTEPEEMRGDSVVRQGQALLDRFRPREAPFDECNLDAEQPATFLHLHDEAPVPAKRCQEHAHRHLSDGGAPVRKPTPPPTPKQRPGWRNSKSGTGFERVTKVLAKF